MYAWEQPNQIRNTNLFVATFKQRVKDVFVQKWSSSIQNSNKLLLYKELKSNFGYEEYLSCIVSKQNRCFLTKLRISAHSLKIETGRYARERTERIERICVFCDRNEVEDEYHFVIECPAYNILRRTYGLNPQ